MALNLSLPVDASGLAEARRSLAAWLERESIGSDEIDEILIATNEACMNAVEHSGAAATSRVEVSANLDDGRFWLEVSDRGRWREPVPNGDRGHGMGLMHKLMDAVAIDRGDGGTRVRMEKDVHPGPAAHRGSPPASLTMSELRGVAVATFAGEVDLAAVQRLGGELEASTGASVAALVVDLTETTYLDSSGVHMVFKLARRRHAVGTVTRLAVGPGSVRRVLELTGAEAVLAVHGDVDGAIEGL